MNFTNIQKVWRAGTNTLVVTIPKNIRKLEKIQEGDLIEINFTLVQKKEEKKSFTVS